MTNYEKETIILFNEEEQTARIETFNGRLLRRLRKISESEGVSCEEDDGKYGVYEIPKTMIKIHAPRVISVSEEQRQLAKEKMAAINRKKHALKISSEVE